jgi:hypothetical protein
VAWDPGVVERPTSVDEARWFLLANWPLLLPFLALVLMYRHWAQRGRDPEIRPIAPRYEPPAGLAPAEVGVLADNSADMRDLTATIVDLAVRGYLIIEEREEQKLFGLLKDRDYAFRLVRPRSRYVGPSPRTWTPVEERAVSLARRTAELADEADALRAFVERTAPAVAPNLAAMAGPVLAARLIALAGGLETLARKPSGTLQVLGAEDALFAHLRGHGPSPKHGIIYTHEYVRGTHPDHRGSAARALAGKLTIAARIDHYSGDRRSELDAELDERIAPIQSREAAE